MVIVDMLPHAEFGTSDHREDATPFIWVRSAYLSQIYATTLNSSHGPLDFEYFSRIFLICMRSIIEYLDFFEYFSMKFLKNSNIRPRYHFELFEYRRNNLTPNELLKIVFLQH